MPKVDLDTARQGTLRLGGNKLISLWFISTKISYGLLINFRKDSIKTKTNRSRRVRFHKPEIIVNTRHIEKIIYSRGYCHSTFQYVQTAKIQSTVKAVTFITLGCRQAVRQRLLVPSFHRFESCQPNIVLMLHSVNYLRSRPIVDAGKKM